MITELTRHFVQVFEDSTVTLRERDSTKQVRIDKSLVAGIVRSLTDGETTWDTVSVDYPSV